MSVLTLRAEEIVPSGLTLIIYPHRVHVDIIIAEEIVSLFEIDSLLALCLC